MMRSILRVTILAIGCFLLDPFGYGQCLTTFATPPGQTMLGSGEWTAVSVPPTTSVLLNMTTTLGTNIVSIDPCNTVLIANNAGVNGPNVPAGTFITGGTCPDLVQLGQNSTATGTTQHSFVMPGYTLNYPPSNPGVPTTLNCSVCPALFTAQICAGQYFPYYMCPGNFYTISLCSAAALWNSTITLTNTVGTALAAGVGTYDDDGCGTTDGHATLTFLPAVEGIYRIRVFVDPCVVNGSLCGTIMISCNVIPTGIEENSEGRYLLTIQPNPASEHITVRADLKGTVVWTISDHSGRVVCSDRMAWSDRNTIGTTDLAPGAYVLSVTDANEHRATAAFVKE